MHVSPSFNKFCIAAQNAKKTKRFTGTLLALDPGETTGWTTFTYDKDRDQYTMLECGQATTFPMEQSVESLQNLLKKFKPDHVVFERYAVYEWKTDSHAWSDVPTLRVIGCIQTLCIQQGIPYSEQTAQVAKNFCTDSKLMTWGFYDRAQRHSRDAIRHATYYLMFGPKNST